MAPSPAPPSPAEIPPASGVAPFLRSALTKVLTWSVRKHRARGGHDRRHGRAEGTGPNAPPEPESNAWAARFDADWYVARNTDLGDYAADPFRHFIDVGLKEGRSPNPHEEPRERWREILDTAWYLERNPDVREAGIDPIEHYIFHGIPERRRPNRDAKIASRPLISAKIDCIKAHALGLDVALFVTHTADGILKPHLVVYLRSLQQAGISTILIIASDVFINDVPEDVKMLVDIIYCRDNHGFDFAAWAHVIQIRSDIGQARILYLLNDSVFGPSSQQVFEDVLDRVHLSGADMVGLTANWERGWHIQSYFLALKTPILKSIHFRDFIGGVVSYYNKEDVINEYETRLAIYLQGKGFRCDVLFPSPDRRNPTLFHWKELLFQGFPFLKICLLSRAIAGVDTTGWREILSMNGYDVSLADKTLANITAAARERVTTPASRTRQFRGE